LNANEGEVSISFNVPSGWVFVILQLLHVITNNLPSCYWKCNSMQNICLILSSTYLDIVIIWTACRRSDTILHLLLIMVNYRVRLSSWIV